MRNARGFATTLMLLTTLASAEQGPAEVGLGHVNAVLWTQQSIEHQAASEAMYRAAGAELLNASKQVSWASLEKGPASSGRKAIVMDIDETVLDNSPYNAWLARRGSQYHEDSWQDWIALRQATAIPGALEFIKLAKKLKVDVFFITNRQCRPEPADPCPALAHTRENLLRLGVERAADPDALLLKNQQPTWDTSDKTTRRERVAQTHYIVMLVGDDMGDFLPVAKVDALRSGSPDPDAARAMGQLGKRWFLIPNPMYGSWEKALPKDLGQRLPLLKTPQGWSLPESTAARPLRIATWNMAWLANEPLTAAQVRNCRDEARRQPHLDERRSEECRKGTPFRQTEDYERLARHAKKLDADIVGIQEVQGLAALEEIFDGGSAVSDPGAVIPKGTYFLAAYGQGGWQKTAVAVKRAILDPSKPPVVKDFTDLGDALSRDRRGGLEVVLTLKDGSKLTLLSVHLKSRCVEEPLDADSEHCAQLRSQAPVLASWISQKEKDRERYIVLGDFNRNFANASERTCTTASVECKNQAFGAWIYRAEAASKPVVIATSDMIHPAGCFDTRYRGNVIEHIVFGAGAQTSIVPASARTIPYAHPATGLPITDHRKAVALYSDHCVVAVDARF